MTHPGKNARWLDGELERWVGGGIIDHVQAEAIRGLYPQEQRVRPWALIVFSGIGAVIIGLGVILLFAYNWQSMPKSAKLAVVFGALVAAHGAGICLYARSERFRGLGEALGVLGTMFFGAGIWLVAQIYHIEEHFPNAFLFWGLGALAMAWAVPSLAQAVIAAVLLTIWAGVESVEFGRATHAALPIIVVLLGPLAYMKRSRVLLAILMLAFGFCTGFVAGAYTRGDVVFDILLSLAAIYVSLGVLAGRYGKFSQSAPIFGLFGFGAYVVMLYLLTFPDVAEQLMRVELTWGLGRVLYWLVPLFAALAAWVVVAWPLAPWGRKERAKDCPYDLLLIPMVLILCYSYPLIHRDFDSWAAAASFSLVFLAHAGAMMARGCRAGQLGPTIAGSLLLVALSVARYIDMFESLIARGVVFIIVGTVLFCEGIFYVRSRKKQVGRESA